MLFRSYGTNLLVVPPGADPAAVDQARASSAHRRPEIDPDDLIAADWATARERVEAFVDAGITKFVVRPAVAPRSWDEFLDGFAAELVPLENQPAR